MKVEHILNKSLFHCSCNGIYIYIIKPRTDDKLFQRIKVNVEKIYSQ